jgi:hypothetical protein
MDIRGMAIVAACGLLPGCTRDICYVRELPPEAGTRETFNEPIGRVWSAVPRALESLKLMILESGEKEGSIIADTAAREWTFGEFVRVRVTAISEGVTEVYVASVRKRSNNITAPDWERPVLERLRQVLAAKERHGG